MAESKEWREWKAKHKKYVVRIKFPGMKAFFSFHKSLKEAEASARRAMQKGATVSIGED